MSGPKDHAHEQDAVMAAAHLRERREARYTVPIGIEVSGISANGEVFHEHVLTRDVSEWGCGFVVSVELKVDDIVSVRVASHDPGESKEARQSFFQVRRVSREAGGWSIGAWKIDSGDVWGVDLAKTAKPRDDDLASREKETAERGPLRRKDVNR